MTSPFQRCLCLPLLLVGAASAMAASIEKQSPFLPPNHGVVIAKPPAPAPAPNGILARELELRGIIQIGGTFQFSLFSKKEKMGYWIAENESANGISIRDFDAGDQSVTVTKNGRTERLSLVSANERPLPIKNTGPVVSRGSSGQPAAPPPASLPALLQNQTKSTPTPGNVVRRRVILPKK